MQQVRSSIGSRRWRTRREAHREALERALAADVVVSSGGVSVGPH
jgi:molybdopterin biosynthesis enzyme